MRVAFGGSLGSLMVAFRGFSCFDFFRVSAVFIILKSTVQLSGVQKSAEQYGPAPSFGQSGHFLRGFPGSARRWPPRPKKTRGPPNSSDVGIR